MIKSLLQPRNGEEPSASCLGQWSGWQWVSGLSGLVRLPDQLLVRSQAGNSWLWLSGPASLSLLMVPGFLCTSCSLGASRRLYYISHVVPVMRATEERESLG